MNMKEIKLEFRFLFTEGFKDKIYKPIWTHIEVILSNIESLCCLNITTENIIYKLVDHTVDLLLNIGKSLNTEVMFMMIENTISCSMVLEEWLLEREYYESCNNIVKFYKRLIFITENNYDYGINKFV